jgi:hypothetical protein
MTVAVDPLTHAPTCKLPLHSCPRKIDCAMRTFTRAVISVVAGFFLMWPLGYLYGVLNWPTFHSWGLLHGGPGRRCRFSRSWRHHRSSHSVTLLGLEMRM